MNVDSLTMATISINVNLQQSIKIGKSSICFKRQETTLHISDSPLSDLCFFYESHVTLVCASLKHDLTFRVSS